MIFLRPTNPNENFADLLLKKLYITKKKSIVTQPHPSSAYAHFKELCYVKNTQHFIFKIYSIHSHQSKYKKIKLYTVTEFVRELENTL